MTEDVKGGQVAEAACALDQALWALRDRMGELGTEMSWHLTIEMKGVSPPEELRQEAPGRDGPGV